MNGKRKGGIKVHTLMNMQQQVPQLVWYIPAATNDHEFLKHLRLRKNRIAVFDKGYNDYTLFADLCENKNFFVTRLKENAFYTPLSETDIPDNTYAGIIKDERIELEVKEKNVVIKTIVLRRVVSWDDQTKRCFEFLTNLFDMDAGHIALKTTMANRIPLQATQAKLSTQIFLG